MSRPLLEDNFLDGIRIWAESISGQWNGDESGIEEDRAQIAADIVEVVNVLEKLINELKEIE